MNQNLLNNHYKKVADRYDESFSAKNFTGYSFIGEAGARTIIDLMNIRKDDRVVDLGSGTCVTAGTTAGKLLILSPYNKLLTPTRVHRVHGRLGESRDLC